MKVTSRLVVVGLVGLVAFLGLLSFGVAFAQDEGELAERAEIDEFDIEEYFFEHVVITAARHEQRVSESPASVTVITAEDIKNSGALSVADVLRLIPGVDVFRFSPADVNVAIRGHNGPSTGKLLVMIDGRSIYVDYFGIVAWEALSVGLEEIERIEVMRGPSSALYGANAFGGVINIITKSPEELEGTLVSWTMGEYETIIGSAIHAGEYGKHSYKVSLGHDETNHFRNDDLGRTRDDNSNDTEQINLLYRYRLSDTSQLSVAGGYDQSTGETMTGLSLFSWDSDMYYVKINYDYGPWKFQGFANLLDVGESTTGIEHARVVNDAYDFEMQHSFTLGTEHTVTWGLNDRYHMIESREIFDDDEEQNLTALFLQDEYQVLDDLMWTIGLRYDHHPESGDHFSPRTSLVYSPKRDHVFRVSVAQAFKNPNFVQNYLTITTSTTLGQLAPSLPLPPFLAGFPVRIRSVGNEDLDSEEVTSYEAGYRTLLGEKTELNIDLFYKELDDFIRYGVPLAFYPANALFFGSPEGVIPSVLSFENFGDAEVYGGEAGLEHVFTKRVSGFVNYSYQQAHGFTPGLIPEHKANVGLNCSLPKDLSATVTASYVDHHVFDASTFVPLVPDPVVDSYIQVNGRVGWKFNEKLEMALAVFNLFDDDHREFPEPFGGEIGRRATFTLSYKF